MDKSQIPSVQLRRTNPTSKSTISPDPMKSGPAVWDCGSALYDSFELTSFQRQLDSAITVDTARTLSMPHRTDLRRFPLSSASADQKSASRAAAGSKLSRSFQKLLRSVFFQSKSKAEAKKAKRGSGDRDSNFTENEKTRWFVVYEDDDVVFDKDRKEKGVMLSTIAESPEVERKADMMSPEIGPAVRKTMSERFMAASVSNQYVNLISCA